MSDYTPHGIIAAVLTPLQDNLRPDIPAFIDYCQKLLKSGCHGLGILGSTGEANSIHLTDRLILIEQAAKNLPPERLLPGTGSCALTEAIELTSCALKNGIKNVLVVPPFYYAPVSDGGIEDYFNRLIKAINDPSLRIYLYNFPKLTGYRFTPKLIKKLIAQHGPIIAGLKDSSGDFNSMTEYAAINPAFKVFTGTERYLLDMMKQGGGGCISASLNITAPQARILWDQRTEVAQNNLTPLRAIIESYPLVPALKAMIEHQGGGKGWRNMLPPHMPLDKENTTQLLSEYSTTLLKVAQP